MTVRGVLFDKDGTLFDFRRSWSGWTRTTLLTICGGDQDAAQALSGRIGYDFENGSFFPGSPVIAGSVSDIARALSAAGVTADLARLERWLAARAARARMVPAVPLGPLLGRLRRRGLMLGVATNDARAAAIAHLEQLEIVDFFHFVAGYDSGFGAKPRPDMCRAFADAAGVPAADCVMVGDSAHDLVAGRAAGMPTLGVLTGPARRDDLAPLADAVLRDIGMLPAWLDAQG
jgi:phosphoglycolate phosphatase